MKTLFILMLLFSLPQAFADGVTELKDGDLKLSQADAKITNINKICPANPGGIRCMAVGSIVNVRVTMNGCLDRFGGHFSKFQVIKNKGYLYFSAVNILNEASMVTRCVQAPIKNIYIHVPYEGEIILKNMEYMGEDI